MTPALTAVSLFAGIGGFDLAMQRAGVKVVAAVEIDPAARSVLARRFPDVTLFEDVRDVTGDQLLAAGFVPGRGIVTGGFPCQDLSVAGRRGGLVEGTRSGLYWEIDRLVAELRPAWVVLENVPGLLSAVCPCPGTGEHDGCEQPHQLAGGGCPDGCFPSHGGAMGLVLGSLADRGYGFAYRVLDAQHFGVPQRRRRVFIVGRAGGDPRGPVEVLLEPEGGAGNPAPGGEARQDVAGTLGGGSGTRGWAPDTDRMTFIPVTAPVTAKWAKGTDGPSGDEAQNLLPVAFDAAQITSKTNRSNPQPGDPAPSLAATSRTHVTDTLRSHPRPGSNSVGAVVPIAFRGRGEGSRVESGEPGDPAFALRTPGGGSSYPMVATAGPPMAFNPKSGGDMRLGYGEMPTALTRTVETAVHLPAGVRRLTPLECERLQGFPDLWTAGQSDAPRYRQLGNAVAVPVVEWVSRRVVAAHLREVSE